MPVDLDAAIDTVAREMTEGEPSGALRARVIERIEQGRRRTSPAVPRWAWAGAAVVLAAATALWVTAPMRIPAETKATVAEQRAGGSPVTPSSEHPAVPSAARSARAAAPDGVPASAARVSRAVAVRDVQAAGIEAARDFNTVPPLAEIEPLRFAAVEPGPLQIDVVGTTPFPTIEPLDIPSLDRGQSDTQPVDPKKEK